MSLTNALGNAVGAIGKLNGSMLKMNPYMMGLTLATKALKEAFERNAVYNKQSLAINERLAIMNRDANSLLIQNSDVIRDNTGGLMNSAAVYTEFMKMGMEDSRKGTVNFLAGLKATGQNTKAALQLFAGLERTTDLNAKQQEMLANVMSETARQYGRFGEDIVAAVSKLDVSLANAVGINVQATQGLVSEITGKFGSIAGEQAAKLVNSLQIRSAEDIARLTTAGLNDLARMLSEGQVGRADQLTPVLQAAMARMENIMGSMDPVFRQLFATELGLQGILPLMNALEANLKDAKEANPLALGIENTLAVMKAQLTDDAQFRALSVNGQVGIQKLLIQVNAFLDNIASLLQPVSQWFGNLALPALTLEQSDRAMALLNQSKLYHEYKTKLENQLDLMTGSKEANERTAAGVEAEKEAAARARTDRLEANAGTGLTELLGFNPSTAMVEILERIAAATESTNTYSGRSAVHLSDMAVTQLLSNQP